MHDTFCWLSMKYFSLPLIQHLFGIIASVLHLGNIKFEADVRGYASLNNNQEMHWVSKVSPKQTADSLNLSFVFMQLCDEDQEEICCYRSLFTLPLLCSCWGFLLRCYNRA